ncbi:tetrachloroethene dehalogenase [Dehalobacter sp. 14DCB1]|uniref:tetrachloroethene dehalogenase n=1 Tax=Dehalobacter sp. 14DCB1 TaxID=2070227 RepID=UPI001045D72F|nr:tetrachloroethene dehalogenase [Dehalobacter sp. 14DCB1]TCX51680.1 tetrachloroethene dehalogenase [Dehalobacter sp. 14DCB1]
MKIFTVLTWMILGILMLLIQYGIWQYLKRKGKNTIPLQLGAFTANFLFINTIPIQLCGFLANFLFIFTLAWAYASLLEHEYQAVSMGFVFFGGATLIPGIITYRLLSRSEKKSKENSATTSV